MYSAKHLRTHHVSFPYGKIIRDRLLLPFINGKSETQIGKVSFLIYLRVGIWAQDYLKITFQDITTKDMISVLESLRAYFKFLGMRIRLNRPGQEPGSMGCDQRDKSHRTTTVAGAASCHQDSPEKGWCVWPMMQEDTKRGPCHTGFHGSPQTWWEHPAIFISLVSILSFHQFSVSRFSLSNSNSFPSQNELALSYSIIPASHC